MAAKPYTGKVHVGGGRYDWVGRFASKQERDMAVMRRRVELEHEAKHANLPPGERITWGEYVDRYLDYAGRELKVSSWDTARSSLKAFVADFGDRPLGSVGRLEAEDWAAGVPPSKVPIVVMLANRAVSQGLIATNPFKGLGKRGHGRSKQNPPTLDEFARLLEACSALGVYGPQFRAMLEFAAYTGTRPGELYALEWGDIDFPANRLHVRRRLYRGRLDVPKSNTARTVALPPPARDALLALRALPDYLATDLVFLSKTGRRLSQATVSGYWAQVKASAGLDFDFYLATKHYGVHLLYKLGLSQRAIGAQMGWSESAVEKLLCVYGHVELVALGEIDRLYEQASTVRAVNPVANESHGGQKALGDAV
jgi:integrase